MTPFGSDPYLELLKRTLTAELFDESAWSVLTGWRSGHSGLAQRIRRAVAQFLKRRGILVVRMRDFDPVLRAAGTDWPAFGYSMIGTTRMNNVESCIRTVIRDGVPGDLIETGVWRGGSVIFMRAVLRQLGVTDRRVWVVDSFEGLPKPTDVHDQGQAWDLSANSYLAVSLEQVKANFTRFGLLDDQVRFLKGWFRDTLPTAPIDRLALLRLDGDMYSSTMESLESLYHKVGAGGFVIVDDYKSWPACQLAVDRFRADHGVTADLIDVAGGAVYWRVPHNQPAASRS